MSTRLNKDMSAVSDLQACDATGPKQGVIVGKRRSCSSNAIGSSHKPSLTVAAQRPTPEQAQRFSEALNVFLAELVRQEVERTLAPKGAEGEVT
jgi:hypothetical protein